MSNTPIYDQLIAEYAVVQLETDPTPTEHITVWDRIKKALEPVQ